MAVVGRWLCLSAHRKENLQFALLNRNTLLLCVPLTKADPLFPQHLIHHDKNQPMSRHVVVLKRTCG